MLAAAVDHLDGGHRAWSRLSTVSLLPRDPAFLQELQHDVHMGPWRRQLLHEITQDRIHQLIPPCGHGVYHDVTPVDGVRTHPQIVLNFAQDELLRRPAVMNDAVEPGMLLHGYFLSVAPQFLDELVGRLYLRHALPLLSYAACCGPLAWCQRALALPIRFYAILLACFSIHPSASGAHHRGT